MIYYEHEHLKITVMIVDTTFIIVSTVFRKSRVKHVDNGILRLIIVILLIIISTAHHVLKQKV